MLSRTGRASRNDAFRRGLGRRRSAVAGLAFCFALGLGCGGAGDGNSTGTGGSHQGGSGGATGAAGTTGAAGSISTAGTTGSAGASGGAAGTTGAAGTAVGSAGRGGTTGAAGTTGVAGTIGAAGSAGTTGRGGAGGAAGTGGGSAICDPVAQTGCQASQRCTWIITSVTTGHNACIADGTVNVGGACAYGAPGETTGFDNCKKGATCLSGTCRTICSKVPESCPGSYGCNHYEGAAFDPDGTLGIGVCDPICDPLTQTRLTDGAPACGSPNPSAPTLGCFGFPDRNFVCAPIISTTKTHNVPAGTPYTNACAPGFEPLLLDMTGGTTVICMALCKPADTSSSNPGNAAGLPGSGFTCPDRGALAPAECRYWWWLENMSSQYRNTLGFCVDPTKYRYDSNRDMTPDTVWPSCTTLSPTAHNFDATLSDAAAWGCVAQP